MEWVGSYYKPVYFGNKYFYAEYWGKTPAPAPTLHGTGGGGFIGDYDRTIELPRRRDFTKPDDELMELIQIICISGILD